jgi:hypothetical protein
MTEIKHEISRTYVFPQNTEPQQVCFYSEYIVTDVVNLVVSKSGGHRLTTRNGGMVYIPPKWIAIEISSEHGWEI